METQLLIAALKAQLFVLRARLKAMDFLDHSIQAVRDEWSVTSEVADAVEAEIRRLESEL